MGKYAKSAQNVLAILKRMGGTEFEKAFGRQFLNTFWDIRAPNIPEVAPYQPPKQQSDYSSSSILLAEAKTTNVRHMFELQNAAMERRLENIGRMMEDLEISQTRKAARQARLSQQNEESQKKRIERAQRNQKERDDAAIEGKNERGEFSRNE
ncbi:uncharacterized protein N7506_005793 [Penicillium brevicompactum]|uniref:uncharacterized protein n=1 Tax=Penicillium brevicompactum TaxID=5074 RepID=UPI00253FD51B|nr:uncharacterized protein N7506_005793 [Penicillium brevicompactum]KAJ5335857.1 hypothetical protein N7506_005793 [Penicillium brevicompactum]